MISALSIGNETVWNIDFIFIIVPLILMWLTVKDVAQLSVDLIAWSKKNTRVVKK